MSLLLFMDEKIIVSVQYTAEDYARGLKYVQQRNPLVKYIFLLPLAVIFGTLLFLFIRDPGKTVYAFSRPEGFMPIILALIFSIPAFVYLRRKKYSFLVKRQFERQIRSSPALRAEKTIIFDEDGIIGHFDVGSGELDWEAFIEATETEDDIYFFTAKKAAQLFPKRAFENEEQQNRLRELVKRKLGEKAKFEISPTQRDDI